MQRVKRLKDERGALAVVVAILGVVVIGFAAVSIDVAALWSDRQQLQTGADAAALAIAQQCADGDCGTPATTAQSFAAANKNDENATGTVTDLDLAAGTVTVETATVREHWFAPVLGVSATDVTAQATAVWGQPNGGTAMLPIIFSQCEWWAQTAGSVLGQGPPATELVIQLPKKSGDYSCTKPNSGNYVPGGFGYIDTLPGTCTAYADLDAIVSSKTGNTPPSSCDPSDFEAIVASGRPVLLPLFDDRGSQGTNAWYHVSGFAAFRLTGYMLGGQYKTSPAPCSGDDRCIQGYFVQHVDLGSEFTTSPTAPDLGATIVTLTD
jgi:Flp pilus assembly protein TadG